MQQKDVTLEVHATDTKQTPNSMTITCSHAALTAKSTYFSAMLNGSFAESKQDTITIREIENLSCFKLLIDLIEQKKETSALEGKNFQELMTLFSFADRFQIPDLAQIILNTTVQEIIKLKAPQLSPTVTSSNSEVLRYIGYCLKTKKEEEKEAKKMYEQLVVWQKEALRSAFSSKAWETIQRFLDVGALDDFTCSMDDVLNYLKKHQKELKEKTLLDHLREGGCDQKLLYQTIEHLVQERTKENPKLVDNLLAWAVQYEYFDIIRYLVDNGGDLNQIASDGTTLQHLAAGYGSVQALEFLKAHNDKNKSGEQSQEITNSKEDKPTLTDYISGVSFVDKQRFKDKTTPLYDAAFNGKVNTVRWLVNSGGANPFIWMSNADTPRHAAKYMLRKSKTPDEQKNHEENIQILENAECRQM